MSGDEKYEGLTITKKDALVISELVTALVEKLLHKVIQEEVKEELGMVYQVLNELIKINEEGNQQVIKEIKKMPKASMVSRQRLAGTNTTLEEDERHTRPIRKKSKKADFIKHMNIPQRESENDSDAPFDPVAELLHEAEEIKAGKKKPSHSHYDDDDEDNMSDVDYMLKITEKLDALDEEAVAEQKARIKAQLRYEALQEMKEETGIDFEQQAERSMAQEQMNFVNSFMNEVTGGKVPVDAKNKNQMNIFDDAPDDEQTKMDEMFDDAMLREAMQDGNGGNTYSSIDYEDEYAIPNQNMNTEMGGGSNDPMEEQLNRLDQKARESGFRE